jgi:hypothetical protein
MGLTILAANGFDGRRTLAIPRFGELIAARFNPCD